MKDEDKTKEQLLNELVELRQRIAELETSETQHKQVKQTLREAEDKYRSLVDSSPDGITLTDLEGRIILCNHEMVRLHGYESPEAMRGLSAFDMIAPEDRQRALENVQRMLEMGSIHNVIYTLLRQDGSSFSAEICALVIQDPAGNPKAFIVIIRDITERKLTEEAVQEARKYAESIIETVRESLVVLDADLKIISANHSFYQTFKVTLENTIGQSLYDLGNRQWNIPKLRVLLEEILSKNTEVRDFEVEHGFLTIGHRTMLLNTRRIIRDGGRPHLILLAIEDITKRKRAEEELKKLADELARSNADLKEFAYAASHDLQEPLLVVEGFVKLLAKRYKNKLDSNADEFIEYAIDGVKRMQVLIKDLLEYSQVTTKIKDFKPTDCSFVVGQAVANLQASIEESGAVVTHDALPTVMADASQLSRLFQNLIGNAIKFRSEEAPRVYVSAERKGNEWVFSVRDNGIGINPKDRERIFIIFQRLHSKTDYTGTGIGLAICKKIVEYHGGRIWMESEAGKGSTFYFTIPFVK